jgi:hypothetical protein
MKMGREIKHVSLDFDHPIGKAWPGYINEHWKECPDCKGNGNTKAMEYLAEVTRSLVWHIDRLKGDDYDRIGELTTGLCGRPPTGRLFGHDSIDEWNARTTIIKAAGLDSETWGYCPTCNGEGCAPENMEAYKNWKEINPPAGDGWQVWETVTTGSPVSPVFATADELIVWLITEGYRPEAARAFVEKEWVPSGTAYITDKGSIYRSDIDAADM